MSASEIYGSWRRVAGEAPPDLGGRRGRLKPLRQRVEASFTSTAGCQRIPKQRVETRGLFVSFWSFRFQGVGRERKTTVVRCFFFFHRSLKLLVSMQKKIFSGFHFGEAGRGRRGKFYLY